jgi:cysteine desulfurase
MPSIYLDYNASTPIDPAVAAAMRPLLEKHFGNPSSGHWAAEGAKVALEQARGQVAALLGAENHEIIFTSGGSEANNLALKGVAWAVKGKGDHIITSSVEHPAILGSCRFLEQLGFQVTASRSIALDVSTRAMSCGRSRRGPFSSASCMPTTRWGQSNQSPR